MNKRNQQIEVFLKNKLQNLARLKLKNYLRNKHLDEYVLVYRNMHYSTLICLKYLVFFIKQNILNESANNNIFNSLFHSRFY